MSSEERDLDQLQNIPAPEIITTPGDAAQKENLGYLLIENS